MYSSLFLLSTKPYHGRRRFPAERSRDQRTCWLQSFRQTKSSLLAICPPPWPHSSCLSGYCPPPSHHSIWGTSPELSYWRGGAGSRGSTFLHFTLSPNMTYASRQVCTPTVETKCEKVTVETKNIGLKEKCVPIIKTVCTEVISSLRIIRGS